MRKDDSPQRHFDVEELQTIVDNFHRDGFVHVPSVLSADLVEGLKTKTDELLGDPELAARENLDLHDKRYAQAHQTESGEQIPFILRNTIGLDPIFLQTLELPPIVELANAIVGEGCRFCGQNVLRNRPGIAIENWHVDDALFYPVPEDVERHDPRIQLPVLWLTVQIALSDIDAQDQGPTQYVAGSHMAGRKPDPTDTPSFEGRGPTPIMCKAGDVYLHNPQCWHRGAPNSSDRTRYLMQNQYAVDWAFRRFGWMNRVPVPDEQLRTASDRLLSILGRRRPAE
jgi:ectoine hydroxylase-related dioxygenase (phytanoyl-CoA dioxygenase family)